jgi:hypothetical protein
VINVSDVYLSPKYMHGDQSDGYTKLLLHFDGSVGGSNFIDDSTAVHTISIAAGSAAHIDTYKFAPTAVQFSAGRVSTDAHADFSFGTAEMTIDFWMYPKTAGSSVYLLSWYEDTDNRYHLQWNSITSAFATTVMACALTTYTISAPYELAANLNTWLHIAIVQKCAILTFYANGTAIGSDTSNGTDTSFSDVGTNELIIGGLSNGVTNNEYIIDEFRVSKGIARWSSTFIPQDIKYPGTNLHKDIVNAMSLSHVLTPAKPVNILHANLVAFWAMEHDHGEDATDFIGSNVLSAYTTDPLGNRPTKASVDIAHFYRDELDSYINTAGLSVSKFTGDQTFTVVGRMYCTGNSAVDTIDSAYKKCGAFTLDRFAYGRFRFALFNVPAAQSVFYDPDTSEYTIDGWHRIGGVKSTASMQFFHDGMLRHNRPGRWYMTSEGIMDIIGYYAYSGRDYTSMYINYVAIFDTALDIAEMGYIGKYDIDYVIQVSGAMTLNETLAAYVEDTGLPKDSDDTASLTSFLYATRSDGFVVEPLHTKREAVTMTETFMYWLLDFGDDEISMGESFSFTIDPIMTNVLGINDSVLYAVEYEPVDVEDEMVLGEDLSQFTDNINRNIVESMVLGDSNLERTRSAVLETSEEISMGEVLLFHMDGFMREAMNVNSVLQYQLPIAELYIHPHEDI